MSFQGDEKLLRVQDLSVEFHTDTARVRAVHRLSFELSRGEVVGIVGESGCGKSAASLAMMGLLPKPAGRVTGGGVWLDGQELTALGPEQLRRFRGRRMAMIFQDPMTSLNPYLNVEEQLVEVSMLHQGRSRSEARAAALELLTQVGIPEPRARLRAYPHELSGGMRQRVMIAMALLCDPDLLIADEPTTALDVTTQAQILELLLDLKETRKLSLIIITHDLGVVAGTCNRVIVMYAGRMVEAAPVRDLFAHPAHPYTSALLASVPRVEVHSRSELRTISGVPPRLDQGPFTECSFAPRCSQVREGCHDGEPELTPFGPERLRRCILRPEEVR